jgi:hypothetical protein
MARINANRVLNLRARFGLGGPATAGTVDQSVTDNAGAVKNDGTADAGTGGRPDLTDSAIEATASAANSTPLAHATAVLAKAQHGYPMLYMVDDVNVAHGNPVVVTGIKVGDVVTSVIKIVTSSGAMTGVTVVAASDAAVTADAVTFTATDFAADDSLLLLYLARS